MIGCICVRVILIMMALVVVRFVYKIFSELNPSKIVDILDLKRLLFLFISCDFIIFQLLMWSSVVTNKIMGIVSAIYTESHSHCVYMH